MRHDHATRSRQPSLKDRQIPSKHLSRLFSAIQRQTEAYLILEKMCECRYLEKQHAMVCQDAFNELDGDRHSHRRLDIEPCVMDTTCKSHSAIRLHPKGSAHRPLVLRLTCQLRSFASTDRAQVSEQAVCVIGIEWQRRQQLLDLVRLSVLWSRRQLDQKLSAGTADQS